jgi:hypothetical protein
MYTDFISLLKYHLIHLKLNRVERIFLVDLNITVMSILSKLRFMPGDENYTHTERMSQSSKIRV